MKKIYPFSNFIQNFRAFLYYLTFDNTFDLRISLAAILDYESCVLSSLYNFFFRFRRYHSISPFLFNDDGNASQWNTPFFCKRRVPTLGNNKIPSPLTRRMARLYAALQCNALKEKKRWRWNSNPRSPWGFKTGTMQKLLGGPASMSVAVKEPVNTRVMWRDLCPYLIPVTRRQAYLPFMSSFQSFVAALSASTPPWVQWYIQV